MIRNFRSATFVAFGVLAACMASAGPAAAQDLFTSAAKTTVLTGISKTSASVYTSPKLSMDCGTLSLAGTFKSGAKEVTVTPTYTGAKGTPGECDLNDIPFPLDMNGCSYDLTGETTQEDGGKADAIARITCPKGAEITTTGPLGCAIKIPPQTPTSGGVTYTNEPGGKVGVTETLTGLTFTTTSGCAIWGFPSEADTLDFIGSFVLEGFEDLGGPFNGDEFKEGAGVGIEVS